MGDKTIFLINTAKACVYYSIFNWISQPLFGSRARGATFSGKTWVWKSTKPSQTESINAFAKQIQAQDILSFGSLHPDQDDYERILVDLKLFFYLIPHLKAAKMRSSQPLAAYMFENAG